MSRTTPFLTSIAAVGMLALLTACQSAPTEGAAAGPEAEAAAATAAGMPTGPVTRTERADAEARFEMMKSLVGDWVSVGAPADAGPVLQYEMTASNSAVVETVFGGTDHEMVSVYHLDNGRLVMTHYCAMGNQPRFLAHTDTPANVVELSCVGALNVESENDPHMHHGMLTLTDANHLESKWWLYRNLEAQNPVQLQLVRMDAN